MIDGAIVDSTSRTRAGRPAFRVVLVMLSLLGWALSPPTDVFPDHLQYRAMVEAFRGAGTLDQIPPEFRHRLLVPWLASWLPLDPVSALVAVGALAALAIPQLVLSWLLGIGFDDAAAKMGALASVVCRAYVLYGFQALTDAAAAAFLLLGLLLLARKPSTGRTAGLLMVVFLGMLVREPFAILALLILVLPKHVLDLRAKLLVWGVTAATFGIVRLVVSGITPDASALTHWLPDGGRILSNGSRMGSWPPDSVWMLVLPPVLVWVSGRWHQRRPVCPATEWPLGRILWVALLLPAWASTAAWLDARFFWPAYLCAIPVMIREVHAWSRGPLVPLRDRIRGWLGDPRESGLANSIS